MNIKTRRGKQIFIPAILTGIILLVAALTLRQPAVSAGSPPPDVPDFTGEPFTITLDQSLPIPRDTVEITAPKAAWTEVFKADFEGVNWDNQWTNLSISGSPYKYGTEMVANPLDPSSKMVAWAVGTGTPTLNPGSDGYPPNVDTWLITGPFNMSDAIDVSLNFEYSFDADTGDTFAAGFSTDGNKFTGLSNNGGNGSWTSANLSGTNLAGAPQVWIAFQFKSDSSTNPAKKKGIFLDNVVLRSKYSNKAYLPVVVYEEAPTPIPPTPTATPPPPGGDFFQGFTGQITPWEARIWTKGAAYNLSHDGACDENRCGFLNLQVSQTENYVIASPLVQSRPYPYNIETVAKIRSPRNDQDQYGIIFGANYDGGACPSTDFSTCFKQYYELRVRYRNDGTKDWLEYKLKRVDGIDSNNQNFGPDLINWRKVKDVDETGFVEWDVNVSQSGTIRIAANNNGVGEVKDTTYLGNHYFGLIVRNGEKTGAEVKFDYLKIDWPKSFNELYP